MYNQAIPYLQGNYQLQNRNYELYNEVPNNIYRPDDAEEAPSSAPPAVQLPAEPPVEYHHGEYSADYKQSICSCLGRWGYLWLRYADSFGKNVWFYPTEIRVNGVSGYVWFNGRRYKASYGYSQIRYFRCV